MFRKSEEVNRMREKKINKILNMHGYSSNYVFMHNFTPIDVGVFSVKMCKMKGFLHFARFCIH